MKRAELIIGQAYYLDERAGWNNRASYSNSTFLKTAQNNISRKVVIVETQLKTDYEKTYRTRDVFVQYESGRTSWVPLNHIRCTWKDAIRIKTQHNRETYGRDDRDTQYRKHLARKHDREQYKPALRQMVENLKELSGRAPWTYDRIESGFTMEQLNIMNEALSLLKTQKPSLKEVA